MLAKFSVFFVPSANYFFGILYKAAPARAEETGLDWGTAFWWFTGGNFTFPALSCCGGQAERERDIDVLST